jgi:predicted Fe-Mo cluster-binding NifX family protein
MQIAITSQNRRTITAHAGKCRRFWIYDVENTRINNKRLVELPIEQSFHAKHHGLPEALSGISVLITAGMGCNLFRRLIEFGVQPLLADEGDPDHAITDFLAGRLVTHSPELACHDHHDSHHPKNRS